MKGFISQNTHPLNYILLLLVFILGGFFVGNFFSMVLLYFSYGYGLAEITGVVQNPAAYPNGREAVNLFQGISHFCAFTLAPLALILSVGHDLGNYLNAKKAIPIVLLILAALLIVVIMPANSWLIDLNSKMELPGFMSGFEKWAKEKEETLKILTQYLTKFNSIGELILGVIVFALIPAIGEELVFRGVLQKQLIRLFKNPHVGIWITAFIFGAIHMQFYGMLPRTLLGALLGYLYFWSGNIWVPIIGHFMNNGFTVFLMYLVQNKTISYDIDSTDAMPWQTILMSVVLSVGLLYYLRQQFMAMPAKAERADNDQTW